MSRQYSNKNRARRSNNYRSPHHAGNWRKRFERKRTRLTVKVILRQLIK